MNTLLLLVKAKTRRKRKSMLGCKETEVLEICEKIEIIVVMNSKT